MLEKEFVVVEGDSELCRVRMTMRNGHEKSGQKALAEIAELMRKFADDQIEDDGKTHIKYVQAPGDNDGAEG